MTNTWPSVTTGRPATTTTSLFHEITSKVSACSIPATFLWSGEWRRSRYRFVWKTIHTDFRLGLCGKRKAYYAYFLFVQAADWQRSKPRKQASGISLAFLHCRTLASACHIPYKSGKSRGDKRYIDIFIGLLRISRPRGASTWDKYTYCPIRSGFADVLLSTDWV